MFSWLQRSLSRNNTKGRHKKPMLRTYEHTMADKCVGCGLCVNVCPVDALRVSATFQSDQTVNVEHFFLDGSACIQCGLCVEACPMGAIDFLPSTQAMQPKVYTKKELLEGDHD